MIVASSFIALYLHHFQLPPSLPNAVQRPSSVAGQLSVTVRNADTLTSIPKGAQRIPMLQLDLQATCSADIRVVSLALRKTGLGDRSDLEAIYAEGAGGRVSNVQSVSSKDGRLSLRIRDVIVEACDRETITIYANFAATAAVAGEHRFALESVDAAGASVRLLNAQVASQLRRTVGDTQGGVRLEMLDPLSRIRFGTDRTVARIRLTAEGDDAQHVRSIRFENNGSASDDDLQNIVLVTNRAERVSSVLPSMEGKTALLHMNESFLLERGQTRVLELHADVHIGASTTVRFVVEDPADVTTEPVRRRR